MHHLSRSDRLGRPEPKEGVMSEHTGGRHVSDRLHPIVYATVIGLALWLVLSVWGFAADGPTDYLLVIVSGFIFIFAMIPLTLWRMSARHPKTPPETDERPQTFREWAAGEFDTWQDHVKGANAAIEVLLPIAAVAFGMTAFAIVLHVVEYSAGAA
jgi:hypothetical protein